MKCPYCGSEAILTSSERVYNGRNFGNIYLCSQYPKCDAYVGVHKKTEEPLGRLANAELRKWKKNAHTMFDLLWKSGKMTRPDAYKTMQATMEMTPDEAHIGKFDVDQCKLLINKLRRRNEV